MATITDKEFIEPEEIWTSIFKCPNCKEECIQQLDEYCSCCGVKLTWDESAKEYFT